MMFKLPRKTKFEQGVYLGITLSPISFPAMLIHLHNASMTQFVSMTSPFGVCRGAFEQPESFQDTSPYIMAKGLCFFFVRRADEDEADYSETDDLIQLPLKSPCLNTLHKKIPYDTYRYESLLGHLILIN